MKKRELIRILEEEGYSMRRKKGNHIVFERMSDRSQVYIPKHLEISIGVAREVLKAIGREDALRR